MNSYLKSELASKLCFLGYDTWGIVSVKEDVLYIFWVIILSLQFENHIDIN